jgi:hypothetical protein
MEFFSASFLFSTPSISLKAGNKPDKRFFHYYYTKGLHRGSYNAFIQGMYGYRVNSYSSGQVGDIRTGGGHNIHAARGVGTHDFQDKEATVANNSAGCQAIYGQENYYVFIKAVYNLIEQKTTKYYLFDGADIESMLSGRSISPTPENMTKWKFEWDVFGSIPYYQP